MKVPRTFFGQTFVTPATCSAWWATCAISARVLRPSERKFSILTSNQLRWCHRRRLSPFRTWFPFGRHRVTHYHRWNTRMTSGCRCGPQRKCQTAQCGRRSSRRPSVTSCRRLRMKKSYRPHCHLTLTATEQRLIFGLRDGCLEWQSKQQPADPDVSPAWWRLPRRRSFHWRRCPNRGTGSVTGWSRNLGEGGRLRWRAAVRLRGRQDGKRRWSSTVAAEAAAAAFRWS